MRRLSFDLCFVRAYVCVSTCVYVFLVCLVLVFQQWVVECKKARAGVEGKACLAK